MRKRLRGFCFGLLLCAGMLGVDGCNPQPPATPPGDTGFVSMSLDLAGGVSLTSAHYAITGPGGFSRAGTIDLSRSTTISTVVGGLPAGTGFTITITAMTADGTVTCAGSASFDVTARATTAVTVHLTCHEAPRTGSVSVNGTINVCPQIDAVDVVPAEALIDTTIQLHAAAHDLDTGPMRLTYSWAATSGAFDNANAQNPNFLCTQEGDVSITLTVSDGDPSPSCADNLVAHAVCNSTTAQKQSEAKATLKAMFTSEKAWFQEKDMYNTLSGPVGFSPERNNRYRYVLTAFPQSIEDRSGPVAVSHGTDEGIDADFFKYGKVPTTISQSPCVGSLTWGLTDNGNTWTGAAYGDIDGDGTLDIWTISTASRSLSGSGCDATSSVPSGEPSNDVNDVNH